MKKQCAISIIIQNKEAIPVRALPYLTGWELTPRSIMDLLCNSDRTRLPYSIKAYRLDNKIIFIVYPKELYIFSSSIGLCNTDSELNRLNAILALPSGVFVWLQDFIGLINESQNLRNSNPELHIRRISTSLFLNPFIEDSVRSSIYMGFENMLSKKRIFNKILLNETHEKIRKDAKLLLKQHPQMTITAIAKQLSKNTYSHKPYSQSHIRRVLSGFKS